MGAIGMSACVNCASEFVGNKRQYKYCSRKCNLDHYKKTFVRSNPMLGIPSGTVGAIHELLVCADLLKKGFSVFRALSQSCSCDLAVLNNGKLLRVEVTTGYVSPTGKINHPTKDSKQFDILALVFGDGKIKYTPELPIATIE